MSPDNRTDTGPRTPPRQKRTFAFFLSLCLFALGGCGKVSDQRASAHQREMLVASYYWAGMYWADLAHAQGWFAEAGLNVKMVDTNADYLGSVRRVPAGQLDTHCVSVFDVVLGNTRGDDLVLVLNSDHSNGADGILARTGIDSVDQLRGKRIGAVKGSYGQYFLSTVLLREGVPLSEVTIIDTPGEMAGEALKSGACDAVVSWEPVISQVVQAGHAKKLFDTSELPGLVRFGYVFRRAFVQEREGDVRKFVQVWNRATKFMKEHPDEAYAIVARINKKSVDEVQKMTRWDRISDLDDNQAAFSYGAGFDSLYGSARVINDFLIKNGFTDRQLDAADYLDGRFIRTLE